MGHDILRESLSYAYLPSDEIQGSVTGLLYLSCKHRLQEEIQCQEAVSSASLQSISSSVNTH